MKRIIWISGILVVLVGGLLIADLNRGEAVKIYDESDLDGTYFVTVMRNSIDAGVIVHCNAYATATFNGLGYMTADYAERCEGEVDGSGNPVVETGTSYHLYDVAATGDVIISECPDINCTTSTVSMHCKILNKGGMLLCDGTNRKFLDTLSFIAIGVKQ